MYTLQRYILMYSDIMYFYSSTQNIRMKTKIPALGFPDAMTRQDFTLIILIKAETNFKPWNNVHISLDFGLAQYVSPWTKPGELMHIRQPGHEVQVLRYLSGYYLEAEMVTLPKMFFLWRWLPLTGNKAIV